MISLDDFLAARGHVPSDPPTVRTYTELRELVEMAVEAGIEDLKLQFTAESRCPFCGRPAKAAFPGETLFNGAHYNPAADDDRLRRQIGRVFSEMSDGGWHTLLELGTATGDPAASISAQLRHLRKAKHGSWIIDTEGVGGGLFSYRMRMPNGQDITQSALSQLCGAGGTAN